MKPKGSSRADVYVRSLLAGELARTPHGARFTYDPGYLAQYAGAADAAVAYTLPMQTEPHEVLGVNVHPYFAGLLPEGIRLRALVRATKTSEDDLFSLLLAAGPETIGAVHVVPSDGAPADHVPVADIKHLDHARFRELLDQSLRYGKQGSDAAFAGVQPKISAGMLSFPVRASSGQRAYILKLDSPEYPQLVRNEAFFMHVARQVGIDVAKVKLVNDESGESGLLVERFDRIPKSNGSLHEIAQEDVCQLLGRYPADKYRLTLADAARALALVSSVPRVDVLRLLEWQAFAYLIGNGDMHAKNISVRFVDGRVQLTPAYDVLSTLPYGDTSMALELEGRNTRLKAKHFVAFGERHGVPAKATLKMLRRLCMRTAPWCGHLSDIGLAPKPTKHLERSMRERLLELDPPPE